MFSLGINTIIVKEIILLGTFTSNIRVLPYARVGLKMAVTSRMTLESKTRVDSTFER